MHFHPLNILSIWEYIFFRDLFTPDPQRLLVRQLPAASSRPQRQAAGATWVGPLQHYIQRRRPAAGAAARNRPMLCWRPLVGPPRTACSTIAVSSPPRRPLRGWLPGLAGLSLAPAGGRSCGPPRSTDRLPLSRGRRAFLRPCMRKLRVRGMLASLGHSQRGSVDGNGAWLRVPSPRERGYKRGVTAQRAAVRCGSVHDEV